MRIAVTGASGALGRRLLDRLVRSGAERIVAFSRDQHRRDAIDREFGWYPGLTDRIYIGDILRPNELLDIFRGCEVVIHAAALKKVDAKPDEPAAILQTNVIGTQNVIEAASAAGVRKLLIISSDKAVAPENVYGTSKMFAEQLAVCSNWKTWPRGLRVAALRYGNCIGSTESVTLKWREAIARGETLKITDTAMTRFWVTLEHAVDFVMESLAMMRGGEIFVPHIKAAPLVRLADAVGGAPPYEVVGIRPGGEKLHESMLAPNEVLRTLRWRGMYIVTPFDKLRTWERTPWSGELIPPDTLYRSDVWPHQWTVAEMAAAIDSLPEVIAA